MFRVSIPNGIPSGIGAGSPEVDPKWDPKHGPEAGTPVAVAVPVTTWVALACGVSGSNSIHLTVTYPGADKRMGRSAAVVGGGF